MEPVFKRLSLEHYALSPFQHLHSGSSICDYAGSGPQAVSVSSNTAQRAIRQCMSWLAGEVV